MVEAVVAIPFFIIIFAGMVFMLHVYTGKARTMRQAKHAAWSYSMNYCSGSVPNAGTTTGNAELESGLEDHGAGAGADFSPLDKFRSMPEVQSFSKSGNSAVGTVSGKAEASKVLGGYTQKLDSSVRVVCNEEPVNGSLSSVVEKAWDLISGL